MQPRIPLPFSPRLTATPAVFACIFICAPVDFNQENPGGSARQFTRDPTTLASLALSYAQLITIYPQLILTAAHFQVATEPVPTPVENFSQVLAQAVTAVEGLNATIQAMMATGDNGTNEITLEHMQIVVANSLATLKNVQSNEC